MGSLDEAFGVDKGLVEFYRDMHGRMQNRFASVAANQSIMDWICANTTLRGMPFSTRDYEFQTQIINDLHPNLACIKCSQVGMTEVQLRKALAFLKRHTGVSLIFTEPDEKLFRKVSQTRLKPLVIKDAVFNLEDDKDSTRSMSTYQFGDSFLFMTICTETDATSTPADALFHDEVDLSPPDMIALFSSRLQNSDFKIRQGFSTPSFPNYGIDAWYKSSDQMHYLLKCDRCNRWNHPEFSTKFLELIGLPNHIGDELYELDVDAVSKMDLLNSFVCCERCRKPLHDAERQWVPKYPNRTQARGYMITPFSTKRITVPYIVGQLLEYKRLDYIRGFDNTVLGKTFTDSNTQIPIESIEAAMQRGQGLSFPLTKDTYIAAGIDMGMTCHVVIGNPEGTRIYRMEAVPNSYIVEYCKNLYSNYKLVAGACDRLPYTPTANAIRDVTKGKIVPVHYETGPKAADYRLVFDYAEVFDHVMASRTKLLDNVARAFRPPTILALCGWSHQKQTVIEHLRDMYRDEKPEQPAIWVKISKVDHFFHAMGYWLGAPIFQQMIRDHKKEDTQTEIMAVAVTVPGFVDKHRLFGSEKRPNWMLT